MQQYEDLAHPLKFDQLLSTPFIRDKQGKFIINGDKKYKETCWFYPKRFMNEPKTLETIFNTLNKE